MPSQGWQSLLIAQQGDGTAITNSTTEAVLINPQAVYTIPAGFLDVVGKTLRIRAMGRVSNVATTPGTLTLRLRLGGTGITGIVAAASSAMALNTTVKTNVTWILDWDVTMRSVGSVTTATAMHSGTWTSESAVGSPAGAAGACAIPASAPAVGTGFDSTIANQLFLTAQFSVLTATTSIQSHSYKLESIN
jgi:hypothetical protein